MTRHMDGLAGSNSRKNAVVPNRGGAGPGVLAGLLVLALAGAVPGEPASPPVAGAAGGTQRIATTVGNGQLLQLPQPVAKVWISAPGVADASLLSPVQVLVTGKSPGVTQIVLWDKSDARMVYDVLVELDVAPLEAAIRQTAPDAKVEVRAIKDRVLLRGTVPDVDTAKRLVELAEAFAGSSDELASSEDQSVVPASAGPTSAEAAKGVSLSADSGAGTKSRVINHLVIAGEQQVLLRCTIAEVNKSALRQLGINGWLAGDNLRDVFAVNQIGNINPVNIGAFGGQNVIQPNGILFGTDKDGLSLLPSSTFSLGFPRVQMQLFFKAMKDNRLLKILAEPNLVALNGQKAKFLAGGEFPVPVTQAQANQLAITIEWKKFGVALEFLPTVIGRQMIRLNVLPVVSELDYANAVAVAGTQGVIPALKTRGAETTVELASGTTIAIAGLLSEQAHGVAQKVPGLGDVPVLGALFSSVEYQRNITELVILVTPELVSGMHPDQVAAVPGQFVSEPNDWQLYGLGLVEGEPTQDDSTPADALQTAAAPAFHKYTCPPEQMTLHGPWGPAEIAEGKVE